MSNLSKHLDKKNLHHAYLIEGASESVVNNVLEAMKEIKFETIGNPDFLHLAFDTLKIDDARSIKSESSEKGMSEDKKIFLISANSILAEAQNTLLKMFEEPGENMHFFLTVPDTNALLPTFLSRFYVIRKEEGADSKEAEDFLKLSLGARIEFLKTILAEEEEEGAESGRAKALRFLNQLEASLHKKFISNTKGDLEFFNQIFKVREYLRMSGSSVKNLMESLALSIPK